MSRMNWLSQWGPSIFAAVNIWLGLVYNNKRMEEV
jgi:hypothetical protein